MVSLEEVKKKVSNAKQKQPLEAVKMVPTIIAASPPVRSKDFLRTPYTEIRKERRKLKMPLLQLKLLSIAVAILGLC